MMQSNRPYLIRAFYQWIVDNGCVPLLVLNTQYLTCYLPKEYIENGEIVFSLSPDAIRDLKITNEQITFRAAFSGIIYNIAAPIDAVVAIYEEETGEGFSSPTEPHQQEVTNTPKSKPMLRLVTVDDHENIEE